MDVQIQYIATKTEILSTLETYCRKAGVSFTAYNTAKTEPGDYLMLLEPLSIHNQKYALSKIWKRWLYQKSPATRLIVAGYAESQHPNYLNLLDLPKDLISWLGSIYTVAAFPMQYVGAKRNTDGSTTDQYADPWERMLPIRGIDAAKQLLKFMDGHDPHYSINEHLARIRKSIMDLKSKLEEGDFDKEGESEIKELQQEWSYFYFRWAYYKPLFDYLPFSQMAATFSDKLREEGDLERFFKKELKGLNSIARFEEVGQVFGDLIKVVNNTVGRHVYPEHYW